MISLTVRRKIMGIAVASILAALGSGIKFSALHRQQASASVVVVSAAAVMFRAAMAGRREGLSAPAPVPLN